MKTIFSWSSSHPWLALGMSLVFTLGLSWGVVFLKVDASMDHLLSMEDPQVHYLNDVRENFGNKPLVLALVESPGLFRSETLSAVKAFADELAKVEGVEEVSSIFNVPVPVLRGDSVLIERVLADIPLDAATLDEKRLTLLGNSLINGNLINEAADTTALLVFLEPESGSKGNHAGILSQIEVIRGAYEVRLSDSVKLSLLGAPVAKVAAERHIHWDLEKLAPISMLVIGVVIFLFYRSLTAVFMPLLTGSLSVMATLGFMGLAGYEISIFLSTIIVLILVLGCTEDLHILSEYMSGIEEGMDKMSAIRNIGSCAGIALTLASATTVLSFVTVAFTEIVGLRHFAVSCAVGMTVNFLITIFVLPALLAILPVPRISTGRSKPELLKKLEKLIIDTFLKRRGWAVAFLLGIMVLTGAGAARLETNTSYLRLFSGKSPVVEAYNRFADAFGGASFVTVTFETHEYEGVAKPENLKKLYLLHEFLDRDCGNATGYVNFLNEFQEVRLKGTQTTRSMPSEDDVSLFKKMVPKEKMKAFLDFDGSRTAIQLRTYSPTSSDIVALESRILNFAKEHLGDSVEVKVTGEEVIVALLCDVVTQGLVASLVGMGLLVSVLISIFVRSASQGLVAVIPNLFPIATTFGVMGWLGIPLSIGNFPVTIVAFGIAVDDTIHFMVRFNLELRRSSSVKNAIARSLSWEIRPILATCLTVAAGFLVMMLSPFRINKEIGLLFALATISGVVADLILTPILLSFFRKRDSLFPGPIGPSKPSDEITETLQSA